MVYDRIRDEAQQLYHQRILVLSVYVLVERRLSIKADAFSSLHRDGAGVAAEAAKFGKQALGGSNVSVSGKPILTHF